MIVGTTYLERGLPVLVLIAWKGPGPRNVLIRRLDGTRVVRPFRGLRRAPEIPPAALAVARSAEALSPCPLQGEQSHQETHPHPGRRGRLRVLEHSVGGPLRRHDESAPGQDDAADPPVLRIRLRRDHDGLHRPARVRPQPASGELARLERRLVRLVADQRGAPAPVPVWGSRVDRQLLPTHERPRTEPAGRSVAVQAVRVVSVGRWLLTVISLVTAAASTKGLPPLLPAPVCP